MSLSESELILNPDGSIYHLHLYPRDVAPTILTVGDPDRVEMVSGYFDSIEVRKNNREFKTHTGTLKGQRITVLSTGIGTDNIDIVFNELDALVNIDFKTRQVKKTHTSLNIIRIGTSGAIQPDIPVDSMLVSELAIGFDNLLHFYETASFLDTDFSEAFVAYTDWFSKKSTPYVVHADPQLLQWFSSEAILKGCTTTNVGFYGPQGRVLRLPLQDTNLNEKIASFRHKGIRITNLEMETAGIYGMSRLLGHRALSLNAILANRPLGSFSTRPEEAINRLIRYTLEILTK